MTWSMSPMSLAWSTLIIVSANVCLPRINVFDVVIVVVVVDSFNQATANSTSTIATSYS